MILDRARQIVIKVMVSTTAVLVIGSVALYWLWRDRPDIDDINLPRLVAGEASVTDVTVTWLGVSTLLFDDGDTQLLIDGFISRPTLTDILLGRDVSNDVPTINAVMHDYGMRRLAAIIPVHSHFDHAMDIGAIANRSSASILGSESSANIARGSGVPEDQILVVEHGQLYEFGQFSVALFEVPHAPIAWRGTTPMPGSVDEPLQLPAPIAAMREGGSYSIVISHPQGTALVQGSAGFTSGLLDDVPADVVFLGVGMLESLGRDHAEQYWQALVTATGASRVIPIHFDDFTAPFGEIRLGPRFIDDFAETARWLERFRQTWDRDVELQLPEFGAKATLYPVANAAYGDK